MTITKTMHKFKTTDDLSPRTYCEKQTKTSIAAPGWSLEGVTQQKT